VFKVRGKFQVKYQIHFGMNKFRKIMAAMCYDLQSFIMILIQLIRELLLDPCSQSVITVAATSLNRICNIVLKISKCNKLNTIFRIKKAFKIARIDHHNLFRGGQISRGSLDKATIVLEEFRL
jgi:hypothetical protein